MKHILILTSGTRGDVQPFVALGRHLQHDGDHVTMCTHERFRSFIEQHGLTYAFMNDDLLRLADTQGGRALTQGKGNILRAAREMKSVYARTFREAQAAARHADLIVYHPKVLAGPTLAEAQGVPAVMVLPAPAMTPTRAFALPLLGEHDWGARMNLLSYAPLRLSTLAFRGELNRWRHELGQPPEPVFANPHRDAKGHLVPTLYPVSQHVVPRPHDWPDTTVLTGYWFLDDHASYEPPAELADFLDSGQPPVVISFSSIVGTDPGRRTDVLLEVIDSMNIRAILVTGQGGIQNGAGTGSTKNVLILDSAPFEWLFPRAIATVHHGGAGTTAEALRAGVPSLVCPFFGDQPYWGARVHRLGVGPKPIPQKRLTTHALSHAIDEMLNDHAMRDRAMKLGQAIRAEDGVGTATEFLRKVTSPT